MDGKPACGTRERMGKALVLGMPGEPGLDEHLLLAYLRCLVFILTTSDFSLTLLADLAVNHSRYKYARRFSRSSSFASRASSVHYARLQ